MATYTCKVQGLGNSNSWSVGLQGRTGASTSNPTTGKKLYNGDTFTSNEQQKDTKNQVWYLNSSDGSWYCGAAYIKATLVQGTTPTASPTSATVTPAASSATTTATSSNDALTSNTIYNQTISMVNNNNKKLEDSLRGSMRLFGLPHQFTRYTDHRISSSTNLGRVFTETFIAEANKVFIKPGTADFLPQMKDADKKGFLAALLSLNEKSSFSGENQNLIKKLNELTDKQENIKYFDFKNKYDDYMSKANLLCRVGAVLTGVNKLKVPWVNSSLTTFGNYDWRHYTFESTYKDYAITATNPDNETNGFLSSVFKTNPLIDNSYIEFYVDGSSSFSESGSNSTTSSMVKTYTDQLSSIGKEIAFISGATDMNFDQVIQSGATAADETVDKIFKGNSAIGNFFQRLTGTSSQLLAGGNFIAPDIWSESDYSKNYSFSITLATPYGNKMSWFLNIWVPLAHILAMTLPTQLAANTYTAPYIVKAFSPGWFSCDLGIIDSISIDKAPSGDAWTPNGMPLEVKVSLSIKDLYSQLALPEKYNITDFFNNDSLMAYLLVNCGIDLTDQNFSDKVNLFANLFVNSLSNKITTPVNEFMTSVKDKIRSIYNLYN